MLERHHALDLVRGLAALRIATYHWFSWSAEIDVQSLGTFGVYLFFVLSALTMAMVYCPSYGSGLKVADMTSFYRNRIARLLPLLLAVALTSLCLALYAGQGSSIVAARAALTGSGLFALGLPGLLSNTTGAWSLGIEIVFYAVFPLLALAIPRVRIVTLSGITVGLMVAQQAFLWVIRPVSDPSLFWNY
ncbi:MAG: acyltransferase family protein, partial [Aureliella sp.]